MKKRRLYYSVVETWQREIQVVSYGSDTFDEEREVAKRDNYAHHLTTASYIYAMELASQLRRDNRFNLSH